jgi:hypothetical protein
MNDLHTWLSQQHHGLRTFRTFQQKLDDFGNGDPGHADRRLADINRVAALDLRH